LRLSPETAATDKLGWVDGGSSYSYPNSLIGSAASERWDASSYTGVASGPGNFTTTYFHLYGLTVNLTIDGGGSPSSPALEARQLGQSFVAILGPGPNTYFLDAGSNWNVQNPLNGSSAQERWYADGPTSSNLTAGTTIMLEYHHQYPVATNISPQSGGSISNLTGWQDQGTSLQLSAAVNLGWKFEGWNGSGTGAYTGGSNTTSILVGSPIQENATFYPGLKIVAGSNGQVSYSFGSTSGTVQAGTTVTVFAPDGSAVVLNARPSSIFYAFSGWSQGTEGTGSTTSLTLMSPSTAQASFALNIPLLAGIVAVILMVALVLAFALRSRRRTMSWDQVPVPKGASS
ncbi:MAG TPA: hypothetical protein VIW22_03825, partial [Nitrososphaerales archaeon]